MYVYYCSTSSTWEIVLVAGQRPVVFVNRNKKQFLIFEDYTLLVSSGFIASDLAVHIFLWFRALQTAEDCLISVLATKNSDGKKYHPNTQYSVLAMEFFQTPIPRTIVPNGIGTTVWHSLLLCGLLIFY